MFNLEKAIKDWRKALNKNEALEDGYKEELECHLRDKIDYLIGLPAGIHPGKKAAGCHLSFRIILKSASGRSSGRHSIPSSILQDSL